MSRLRISRSPDLQKLRTEGFDIEVRAGHLLVKEVPYVTSNREVKRGTFISTLTLAGDVTTTPEDHVIHFAGEHPCHADGSPLEKIRNQSNRRDVGDGVIIDHSFSAKPVNGRYEDYYAKVTTYVAILEGQAQCLEVNATARTHPVVLDDGGEDGSVFNYVDTASTKAEIVPITRKLALAKIAIVGLGGTGSYVLDLVAKTPVREIHIYDGDVFLQKNAFRAPGAPSVEQLRSKPMKVHYFCDLYSHMHRGIVAHDVYVEGDVVEQLRGVDFVFLCIDRGKARRMIASKLEEFGVPFADVGMGIQVSEDALIGVVRVTMSTNARRDHFSKHVSFADGEAENDYNKNIQIADLNALNAALAVVRWKKLFGFYADLEREHHCTYTVDGNAMTNEEKT
jgi:hypothetical protein